MYIHANQVHDENAMFSNTGTVFSLTDCLFLVWLWYCCCFAHSTVALQGACCRGGWGVCACHMSFPTLSLMTMQPTHSPVRRFLLWQQLSCQPVNRLALNCCSATVLCSGSVERGRAGVHPSCSAAVRASIRTCVERQKRTLSVFWDDVCSNTS